MMFIFFNNLSNISTIAICISVPPYLHKDGDKYLHATMKWLEKTQHVDRLSHVDSHLFTSANKNGVIQQLVMFKLLKYLVL